MGYINFGTSICRTIKLFSCKLENLSILCLVFGKHGDTPWKFWKSTYILGTVSGEKMRGTFSHLVFSFLAFLGRIFVWWHVSLSHIFIEILLTKDRLHVKCAIWCLAGVYTCETITMIKLINISITPKVPWYLWVPPHTCHPLPLILPPSTDLLSVTTD